LNNAWLYLPESWTDNKSRCIEAGIPEDVIEFLTKRQISALMAEEYFSTGNMAYWVSGDSVYGDCPELKLTLIQLGKSMYWISLQYSIFIKMTLKFIVKNNHSHVMKY